MSAALAREAHRGQRIGGLAGLGDPDDEVPRADHGIAVAVLGGDVHLDRDPRPGLHGVAADEARVVGGAAGDDHDPPQRLRVLGGQLELAQVDRVDLRQPVGDRLGDRVGLLVDLLEHEGGVAAPLGLVLVPGDLLDLALARLAGGVGDHDALGADRDDLAVLDLHHGPGLAQEGGDRRGEEGLPLADADHERAFLARGDERLRVLDVHRYERVVAADLAESGADRGRQVAVVVALDQVGDDLGVGLGAELVTLGDQLAAELGVVLDDPVEHDVDVAVLVAVGVGVLLGDPSVGGPAGVREADRRLRLGDGDGALVTAALDRGAKVREVADRAHGIDSLAFEQGEARGVVSTVFELLEPGDQKIATGPLAHVSDDAAHRKRRLPPLAERGTR